MPRPVTTPKIPFEGEVLAVKARIRLIRSFDEISHQYQGYTLVMRGVIGDGEPDEFRIGIGPGAHKKHQFRIGDVVKPGRQSITKKHQGNPEQDHDFVPAAGETHDK